MDHSSFNHLVTVKIDDVTRSTMLLEKFRISRSSPKMLMVIMTVPSPILYFNVVLSFDVINL